jgi:hypothetical protein
LEEKGIYTGAVNKRLSKGMAIVAPGVNCIVLDCTKSDFLDMTNIIKAGVAADASGEG